MLGLKNKLLNIRLCSLCRSDLLLFHTVCSQPFPAPATLRRSQLSTRSRRLSLRRGREDRPLRHHLRRIVLQEQRARQGRIALDLALHRGYESGVTAGCDRFSFDPLNPAHTVFFQFSFPS